MIHHLCLTRHGEYNGNWDHWVERLEEFVKVKELSKTTSFTFVVPFLNLLGALRA